MVATPLQPLWAVGGTVRRGDDGEYGERPRADAAEAYAHGASVLPTIQFAALAAFELEWRIISVQFGIAGRYFFVDDLGPAGYAGWASVTWDAAAVWTRLPAGTRQVTVETGAIGPTLGSAALPGSYELLYDFVPVSDIVGMTPTKVAPLAGNSSVTLTPPSTLPEGWAVVVVASSPLMKSPPPYPGGWTGAPQGNAEVWGYSVPISMTADIGHDGRLAIDTHDHPFHVVGTRDPAMPYELVIDTGTERVVEIVAGEEYLATHELVVDETGRPGTPWSHAGLFRPI